MRRVYMDANATTPVLLEVWDAMRPYMMERFGNASSIYLQGQQARAAVEQARATVAAFLGCRPAEIVFTSGGTESDNTALLGMAEAGDHIITTKIEHHAILHSAARLQNSGVDVTFLPVSPQGIVDPDDVRKALLPNTKLISVMFANNETGAIQPIEEIGRIAQEADVYFHTDAVQAAGKIPIDVETIGCDLLSLSGHKFHAPQGIGVLYVRRGTHIKPLLVGGPHERQRRAGTENVAGIVGLGQAVKIAAEGLKNGKTQRIAELRDRLESGVTAAIGAVSINGKGATRVPNTSNIQFNHLEGEALLIALDLKGLAVSGGSACQSGATNPSHVLLAMGLNEQQARASLRFSLMETTTDEDVDFVLEVLPSAVRRLRKLSPVYENHTLVSAK